jgi:hypothetical protein
VRRKRRVVNAQANDSLAQVAGVFDLAPHPVRRAGGRGDDADDQLAVRNALLDGRPEGVVRLDRRGIVEHIGQPGRAQEGFQLRHVAVVGRGVRDEGLPWR